jgi:hypothetical protein
VTLAAPAVLREVRSACDGPIVVMKGPELAARYPEPALRPYADLDLLVPDADRTQRALLAAGFRPVGDPDLYRDIHHLRPLHSPSFPLYVEVHSRPKWLDGRAPPPVEEFMAAAQPAAVGVDGVLALAPSHHALVIAAHWWAHEPFSRVIGLLDVAAVLDGCDRRGLEPLARAWGIGRLWRTTISLADALLLGEGNSWALRLWGRNLTTVQEQSVLESHLRRTIGAFWALPPHRAVAAVAVSIREVSGRNPDESWRAKLRRARLALARASLRRSEHERSLGRDASPPVPDGPREAR